MVSVVIGKEEPQRIFFFCSLELFLVKPQGISCISEMECNLVIVTVMGEGCGFRDTDFLKEPRVLTKRL